MIVLLMVRMGTCIFCQGVAAGGLLDIIADGETGYLTENADDMAEFSERVRQLTTDKDLRKRFGESGLAWAQVSGCKSALKNYYNSGNVCMAELELGSCHVFTTKHTVPCSHSTTWSER